LKLKKYPFSLKSACRSDLPKCQDRFNLATYLMLNILKYLGIPNFYFKGKMH
jgi:hypothetical protein